MHWCTSFEEMYCPRTKWKMQTVFEELANVWQYEKSSSWSKEQRELLPHNKNTRFCQCLTSRVYSRNECIVLRGSSRTAQNSLTNRCFSTRSRNWFEGWKEVNTFMKKQVHVIWGRQTSATPPWYLTTFSQHNRECVKKSLAHVYLEAPAAQPESRFKTHCVCLTHAVPNTSCQWEWFLRKGFGHVNCRFWSVVCNWLLINTSEWTLCI